MELMNQPFTGQLGNRLIELLDSSDYHTLNIAVAFAKNSGVLRIKDSLERFRAREGKVNVYVGVDLGGTSYEALTALLLHTDSLNVVHSENGQTFHPKIYQFVGKEKGLVVIGSHNLTAGGLWTNFESSVLIPVDWSGANEVELLKGLDEYIENLSSLKDSFMPIDAQDDIDKLLQNGYIFKEVTEQVHRAKVATLNGTMGRLFGNGAPAKLPSTAMLKKQKTAAALAPVSPISDPLNGEGQTIWFETRSMTSESRNILDLSMTSLIERGDPTGTSLDLGEPGFMRGAVQFFGLNPTDTAKRKNITLNFEGIDYTGSTILFPDGDKANGTWRLQIHGKSSSNVKITEVFKDLNAAEGERYNKKGVLQLYLQLKIITFTKIQDDYYSMSVFPESELENFRKASRILARNGRTNQARQLGLL
ncbi:phospholipase D family protein [Aeromonas caviae]|uniref:phospholipase D family protein n=1 Tax=Aeromonas caviae TaxID=648 RepID=UPI002B486FB4|nr:phospholipase D family protein [Aeromonas caviae]